MTYRYSCIFLFLFLWSSVFTQARIHVDETNIDFNHLPEVIIEIENNEPFTGVVFALYNNGNKKMQLYLYVIVHRFRLPF